METPIIVANLKAYLAPEQLEKWFSDLSKYIPVLSLKTVIVAVPTLYLLSAKEQINELRLPIFLASQDVSAYEAGAFTGETPAEVLRTYVQYSIIAHSERRTLLHETDMLNTLKTRQALIHDIKPIYCVSDGAMPIPDGVRIVAYEPVGAIGTGQPDIPEDAALMSKDMKSRGVRLVLYGGSINSENVYRFTAQAGIDGVLVGKASATIEEFIKIVQNA